MEESTATDDRRFNLKLRAVFDEAYQRISPFLDPEQGWGGMNLELLAFRVLREAYPQFSSLEVHQLILASVRVYATNHPEKAGHLTALHETTETTA